MDALKTWLTLLDAIGDEHDKAKFEIVRIFHEEIFEITSSSQNQHLSWTHGIRTIGVPHGD